MATLKLTLSKKPYEVMVTGEKQKEYRLVSKWMESRLFDKKGYPRHYDFIQFTNGYKKDSPKFICQYKGVSLVENVQETFSNGLTLDINEPTYVIHLGDIFDVYL